MSRIDMLSTPHRETYLAAVWPDIVERCQHLGYEALRTERDVVVVRKIEGVSATGEVASITETMVIAPPRPTQALLDVVMLSFQNEQKLVRSKRAKRRARGRRRDNAENSR